MLNCMEGFKQHITDRGQDSRLIHDTVFLPTNCVGSDGCKAFLCLIKSSAVTYGRVEVRGVAIKKPDCLYYSFPATSMTKRRVGH